MAARLVTSSPSSLVVLATAQPSSSSSRRSAKARLNTMRPNAGASNSSAAVSAAAASPAETRAKPHSASTPRPDAAGRFGAFGGKYVPETLIAALTELEEEYTKAQADPAFKVRRETDVKKTTRPTTTLTTHAWNDERGNLKPLFPSFLSKYLLLPQAQFESILKDYVGRPSPLYHAERLTEHYGGAEVWLKREDLNHTGAHKINNSLGQVLLCLRMSKKRIIAETGAGQHGVATATVCAKFGLPCIIYMGEEKTGVFL